MLTVGPNSTCDVCLEPFGKDNKGPCSITCGHVFCASCLGHITRSNCPLCRIPFSHTAVVRLHVDLDSLCSSPRAPPAIPSTDAEHEARRFQDAIARITNQGSSEQDLRKLLGEAREFLRDQPREKFTDLRVIHRMMLYLCDVKSNLIEQKKAVDNLRIQIAQLNDEKAVLRDQLEAAALKNQSMLDESLWLRSHADKAQEAYLKLVESYNDQVRRLLDLTEKYSKLREDSFTARGYPVQVHYVAPEPEKPDLDGVVEQVPDSYLISPLPQFTGRINNFDGTGLPDVSEEEENTSAAEAAPGLINVDERPHCGAAGHPLSCECEPLSMFSPPPEEIRYTTGRGRVVSRRPSLAGGLPSFSAVPQFSTTPPDASQYATMPGMSHYPSTPEATYDGTYVTPRSREFVVERSRSRSRSDRTRPISRGTSRTDRRSSPNRPASPSRSVSYLSQSRTGSSRDVNTPNGYPTPPSSGRDGGDTMRTRLHDILDSATMPSSSLPNVSGSHFPSSYRERTPMQDDPEGSRPPSRGARRSNSDNYAQNIVRPSSSSVTPTPTPPPNPVVQSSGRSTASQAAAALEERQRQERRERRKAEKEKERAYQLELERERTSGDVQRSRASNEEVPLQPREINVYGNPNSGNSSSSHGRHTSTSASSYSRSGSGVPSSLREASSVHAAYQSRKGPSPVPISTTPGIYA